MKTINALLLSFITILAAACGNSMTSAGYSGEPIILSILGSLSNSGAIIVSLTTPADASADIPLGTTVTAVFNTEARCSTITDSSFTLTDGVTPVAGAISCTGLTATFTPTASLSAGTVYTATLTTAVENLAGSPMAANHTWTFTTAAGGPAVSATSPVNNATGVLSNAVITATFGEEIRCSTISASSFTLSQGGTPVTGTISCTGLTAIFIPPSLAPGTLYTATVTTAVENLAGDPITADHVWTFTTESTPTLEQKMRGIWVIGGAANIAGTSIVPEIDLYDPATDTWYPDAAAGASGSYAPTIHGMAVFLSGKIYVMGGLQDTTNPPVSRVQEYDIATNSWTLKASINVPYGAAAPRASSACYTNLGLIYIVGGSQTNVTGGGQASHFCYDPVANTWGTPLTIIPGTILARTGFGFYNFNGSFSFAGGKVAGGTSATTNEIYMVLANTYTTGTEQVLTSARSFMASAGYAGSNGTYLFLAGGANTTTPGTAFFNFTAIQYVPTASSFIVYLPPASSSGILTRSDHPSFPALPDTTKGIAFHAGAVAPYNGTMAAAPMFYIFGGIKNMTTVTTDVSAISANGTVSGTTYATPTGWSAKTAMPRARYGHSVVVVDP